MLKDVDAVLITFSLAAYNHRKGDEQGSQNCINQIVASETATPHMVKGMQK